eukprot:SAG31_NODE_3204_length_4559_cov_1.961211_2_plen_89_part_00
MRWQARTQGSRVNGKQKYGRAHMEQLRICFFQRQVRAAEPTTPGLQGQRLKKKLHLPVVIVERGTGQRLYLVAADLIGHLPPRYVAGK